LSARIAASHIKNSVTNAMSAATGIVCSGLSEPEKRQPVGPAPARRKAAPASPTGLPVSTLPTRLQQAKKTIVVASCPTIATVSGGFRSINLR